jgi:hypothetical protein
MNKPKIPSLVTVATFDNLSDAHIYRGKLEANGIPCQLENENMVHINWLYANAVGGIKLKVSEQDVQIALSLINEAYQSYGKSSGQMNNDLSQGFFVCPACGFLNEQTVNKDKNSFISWLTSLWKGSPKFQVCKKCNSSWTENELLK